MKLPNIFTKEVSEAVIARINQLNENSVPKWGKMSAAKMMTHCCVTYEFVYEDKYKKPGFFMKLMLKAFVKKSVVNDVEYLPNRHTAPEFIIKDETNFEAEKNRLIGFIVKTQALGENYFDGKESHSFGNLTKEEWNNLFYKHLDHHLRQFGV